MLLPHCTGSYLGWDTQLGYSTRATLLYSTGLDGLDGRKGRRVVVDELSSVSLTSATCSKNIVYKEIYHYICHYAISYLSLLSFFPMDADRGFMNEGDEKAYIIYVIRLLASPL